ncbi:MAG: rnhB [Candidatus Saccharibacteria bacterium]|nr:rnhB [Candidatus Saccharibacteria bacterium]
MIGIDEVGRGCWAGPLLVVAARTTGTLPLGLKDSKKLSKKQRENLFLQIQTSCDLGEGWVTAAEIDADGLTKAMELAVGRALQAINAQNDEEIIMDGIINYCDPAFINVKCEAKADDAYPVVSAASIYAKVTRDRYMTELKNEYSVYEFAKHVGYGTKLHSDLLAIHGTCDQHRLSFAPIKKLLAQAI